MPKKTLTTTTTKISTKTARYTAIATSALVLLGILAGFSYGMFIKYKGQKNQKTAEKFFQQYIK